MTIYDIANACGVSIATVSRVLNNSDKVSEKTRQRYSMSSVSRTTRRIPSRADSDSIRCG